MSKKGIKEEAQKKLIPSKQKELEEWDKKIVSGEALKITKETLMSNVYLPCDPEEYLRKVAKEIYPKYRINNQDNSKMTDLESTLIKDAFLTFGVENDTSIIVSIEEEHRGLAIKIRRELIKEYCCETYSEKMMVDMLVSSYMRNITASKKLQGVMNKDTTSDILNKFMSMASQEIDRAQRHFITSLTALKQIKSPNLLVNVKTNNAFFAQNQQINNVDENKVTPNKNPDEIIDHQ